MSAKVAWWVPPNLGTTLGCVLAAITAACGPPEAPATPALRIVTQPERPRPDREARVEVKMPALPAHASCQQARSAYVESWRVEEGEQRVDLSEGQFSMVLGRSQYFDRCGVPDRYEVKICAAVQNGQVLGATVSVSPRHPLLERCIDKNVRALDFPVHPRMDVTRTVFRGD